MNRSTSQENAKQEGVEMRTKINYGTITTGNLELPKLNPDGSAPSKKILITIHDIGSNCKNTFTDFFLYRKIKELFVDYTMVPLDIPGHNAQDGTLTPYPSFDEVADQLAELASQYVVTAETVVGIGIGAGATLLLHIAVKFPKIFSGLVLFSPISGLTTWSEWTSRGISRVVNKLSGNREIVKSQLMQRWFSPATLENPDTMARYKEAIDKIDFTNLTNFIDAYQARKTDFSSRLEHLPCRALVFDSSYSTLHDAVVTTFNHMNRKTSSLVPIDSQGIFIFTIEERLEEICQPLRLFLESLTLHSRPRTSST